MAGHDQHRILPRSREPSGTRIRQGHPSPPMGRCGPARRRRHYGLHRPPPRPRRRRRTRRDRPRPGQRHPHRTSDHLAAPMAQRKARRAPDHRVPGRHPGAPHTRWRPNPPARHHSHHRLVSEGGASEVLALSAGVAPVRPGAAAQRDHPASCTAFVHAARPWPCCATWTPPAPASMTLSTPPQSLNQHPDAGIMTSFPVPGSLTGARVLAEIGDDRRASARATRRLPRRVYLTEGDRLLALDLDQPGPRVLLRAHLDGGAPAVLTEAPGNLGWCGGRAHEIVVLLETLSHLGGYLPRLLTTDGTATERKAAIEALIHEIRITSEGLIRVQNPRPRHTHPRTRHRRAGSGSHNATTGGHPRVGASATSALSQAAGQVRRPLRQRRL